jgi:hypothetical protein
MDSFQGIPDTYDGRVIPKRFTSVTTYSSTASDDTYIMLLPTPGVAYWTANVAAGTTTTAMTFTPVLYSDYSTLFPQALEQTVVNAFRYASNVIEIVPTTNEMTWQSNIQVFKGPILESTYSSSLNEMNYLLEGFELINSVKPSAVFPYNCGMYSVTAPLDPNFPWQPVRFDTTYSVIDTTASARTITLSSSSLNYIGLGKQETIIIKLPSAGSTSGINTGIIRTWACVEFQVQSGSLLYDYSRLSPPHDPLALELARRFIHENPAAVPFYDNDTFWQRVNAWIIKTTGVLRLIPGRVGAAAGAVNLLSHTIDPMLGPRDSVYDLD